MRARPCLTSDHPMATPKRSGDHTGGGGGGHRRRSGAFHGPPLACVHFVPGIATRWQGPVLVGERPGSPGEAGVGLG